MLIMSFVVFKASYSARLSEENFFVIFRIFHLSRGSWIFQLLQVYVVSVWQKPWEDFEQFTIKEAREA